MLVLAVMAFSLRDDLYDVTVNVDCIWWWRRYLTCLSEWVSVCVCVRLLSLWYLRPGRTTMECLHQRKLTIAGMRTRWSRGMDQVCSSTSDTHWRSDSEARVTANERTCKRVIGSKILNSPWFIIHCTIHNETCHKDTKHWSFCIITSWWFLRELASQFSQKPSIFNLATNYRVESVPMIQASWTEFWNSSMLLCAGFRAEHMYFCITAWQTASCWVVWHNVHSQQHTHMSSSFRSSRLGLSHWDPYAMHRGSCLEL